MAERKYQNRRLISLLTYFRNKPEELNELNDGDRAILLNSLENAELGLKTAGPIATRYLNQFFDDKTYQLLIQRMNKFNSEQALGSKSIKLSKSSGELIEKLRKEHPHEFATVDDVIYQALQTLQQELLKQE
ncbi:hypothetical protein C2869_04795 [Saccharobesus litoralis]|uniref:Uncharacterized protein n=1 Tax=Saccharobesus litoralis TaxID=2172099 RepID=A0A2S0VNJ8_9ALTE|nr:hypothetical protein [Saccharobesus litoralis]AWB65797.1 hypothetical protein C2869_04795 [Saccharobesus litoralis]